MYFRLCLLAALMLPGAARAGVLDDVTKPQNYEARRAGSSNERLDANGDARSIKMGETLVLMEEEGPGMVTHFWNTIGSMDPFQGRSITLRVYYDGAEYPSVQAPIGDFFGIGHAAFQNMTSLPSVVTSHGRSRTCYWHMPFRQSIKITATNDSGTYDVDSFYWQINWRKLPELPEDTPYFHAMYRQEFPAQPGNYTILDAKGKGHYVGTVLSSFQMETGWFGEGDDFFYVDGAETPQLRGTGTEDYFNDAWGFREFCTPYFGVPLYDGVVSGDRMTAYRWHLEDPVPFNESLHVEIEHKGSIFNDQAPITTAELGGFKERKDWDSSVAYWYQYPAAAIETPLPPAAERIPPYKVIPGSELKYRANPPFLVLQQGPFLAYMPSMKTATMEIDFEAEQDGRYNLSGIFLHGLVAGVYQISLDDKPLGEPYSFVVGQYDPAWMSFDTHDLKAGTHTLKFEGIDTTPTGARAIMPNLNGLGCAYLILLRLNDMEGFLEVRDELVGK
ncbi:MAG: DUF2961 domain-containing protein [Candidatus Hydrogenedens sp.]|nr:DUF2961 domain-containing protein [Candidatus Hydrogenedens sp.]